MGETTKISWATGTWNPWQGCKKVSPACKFCYMYRDKARYGQDPRTVVRSAPPTFSLPLRRKKDGSWRIPPGSRIFTCSWSDWFIEDADPWRDEAWSIVQARPDVTFMVLTKRPERIAAHLPPGGVPRNVEIGVSVEMQEYTSRLDILREVGDEDTVRFVSAEPLLGPLDLRPWLDCLDLVIVGGESGPDARPMKPLWAERVLRMAEEAGVAAHFKQWGEWAPIWHPTAPSSFGTGVDQVWRVGVKAAGRIILEREWDELPGANCG